MSSDNIVVLHRDIEAADADDATSPHLLIHQALQCELDFNVDVELYIVVRSALITISVSTVL